MGSKANLPKFEGSDRDPKFGRVHYLDPTIVHLPQGFNSRKYPITEEAIQEKVDSILANDQLQPIGCRVVNGKLEAYFGFIRTLAAQRIAANDPGFLLKAIVVEHLNETDAFIRNVQENENRVNTSAVDKSYTIHRLIDNYHKTPGEVQAILGITPAKFNELRQIRGFSEEIQLRLHTGDLTFAAAQALHRLTPEQAEDYLAKHDATVADEPAEPELAPVIEMTPDGGMPDSEPRRKPGRPKSGAPKPAKKAAKPAKKKPKAVDVKEYSRQVAGTIMPRNGSDLRKLLKDGGREDDVPVAILAYLDGFIDGDEFMAVIDMAEDAIVKAGDPAKFNVDPVIAKAHKSRESKPKRVGRVKVVVDPQPSPPLAGGARMGDGESAEDEATGEPVASESDVSAPGLPGEGEPVASDNEDLGLPGEGEMAGSTVATGDADDLSDL